MPLAQDAKCKKLRRVSECHHIIINGLGPIPIVAIFTAFAPISGIARHEAPFRCSGPVRNAVKERVKTMTYPDISPGQHFLTYVKLVAAVNVGLLYKFPAWPGALPLVRSHGLKKPGIHGKTEASATRILDAMHPKVAAEDAARRGWPGLSTLPAGYGRGPGAAGQDVAAVPGVAPVDRGHGLAIGR